MDISRRAIFALPAALPIIMLKPSRSTAWTDEEAAREAASWEARALEEALAAQECSRGSCAGWIETYSIEHDIGYIKCFDERPAFFRRDCVEKDELLVCGTKVFVHWSETPGSLRQVEMALAWREAGV